MAPSSTTTPGAARPGRWLVAALGSLWLAAATATFLYAVSRDAWSRIALPGPADPPDVLMLVLGVTGAAMAAWFGLGMALASLAALPGAAGVLSGRLGDRLAPAAARRLVAVLMGTTLTAALLPGATAVAAPSAQPGRGTPASRQLGRPPATALVDARPQPPLAAGVPDPAFAAGRPQPPLAAGLPDPAFHAPSGSSPSAAPVPHVGPAPGLPDAPGLPWTPSRPHRPRTTATPSLELLSRAPVAGRSVDDHVVVRGGDTLWDIAARHLGPRATAAEIAREWPRWFAANRGVIGEDPDSLLPGQLLHPPTSIGGTS